MGRIGRGTKNTCEFAFTNTGRAPLKITKIKSTCGCTVTQLEKREYVPGESGTIKVTYTAPKATITTQKHIYVSSNDKDSSKVKLVAEPQKSLSRNI